MQFVLVHGGWQGSWCWDEVKSELVSRGHEVLTPSWLGLPEQPVEPLVPSISNAGDTIARDIENAGFTDFVLAGHSGGGPICQHVADRLLPRVKRLVFVNGWVLKDGECIADLVPIVEQLRPVAEARPDNSVPIPPGWWDSQLMNGADLGMITESARKLVPLPMIHFDDRVSLPRLWQSDLPVSYIVLDDDIAAPDGTWAAMADRLEAPRIVHTAGPHQAMLTHPQELASALLEAS